MTFEGCWLCLKSPLASLHFLSSFTATVVREGGHIFSPASFRRKLAEERRKVGLEGSHCTCVNVVVVLAISSGGDRYNLRLWVTLATVCRLFRLRPPGLRISKRVCLTILESDGVFGLRCYVRMQPELALVQGIMLVL